MGTSIEEILCHVKFYVLEEVTHIKNSNTYCSVLWRWGHTIWYLLAFISNGM